MGGFAVRNALPEGDSTVEVSRSASFGPAYSKQGSTLSTSGLQLMLQLKAKECFAIEEWLSGEGESGWCISGASTQVLMIAATDFPLASSWQLSVRSFPVAFFSSATENGWSSFGTRTPTSRMDIRRDYTILTETGLGIADHGPLTPHFSRAILHQSPPPTSGATNDQQLVRER